METLYFEPVWISTIDHLKKYGEITSVSTSSIIFGGKYKVPKDFPYTQMTTFHGLIRLSPVPMILVSSGRLEIHSREIKYFATPMQMKGNIVKNVLNELTFAIQFHEFEVLLL